MILGACAGDGDAAASWPLPRMLHGGMVAPRATQVITF